MYTLEIYKQQKKQNVTFEILDFKYKWQKTYQNGVNCGNTNLNEDMIIAVVITI